MTESQKALYDIGNIGVIAKTNGKFFVHTSEKSKGGILYFQREVPYDEVRAYVLEQYEKFQRRRITATLWRIIEDGWILQLLLFFVTYSFVTLANRNAYVGIAMLTCIGHMFCLHYSREFCDIYHHFFGDDEPIDESELILWPSMYLMYVTIANFCWMQYWWMQ